MVNLVIFESHTKAVKVKKFLGKGFECIASSGHCIDLPQKKFGVDLKNDFKPTYVTIPGKGEILKKIVDKAKKADTVYLMADPDREGEAIAWHLSKVFPKDVVCKRVTTNAIEKEPVLEAFKNPTDINFDMVNSYECRRILDRLVGYKCSYPVKQATGGISVGRTQSAGLRVLGEREKEIKAFIPETYYTIEGTLLSKDGEKISVTIKIPKPLEITAEETADEILKAFHDGPIVIAKFVSRNSQKKPSAPFKTSSLQQAASTYLGMSPKRTMRAAQKLYENGMITYHRTDSANIIPAKLAQIRAYIKDNFDSKYSTPAVVVYKTKSKNAQEAHEAIRPTNITKSKAAGESDEARLYNLIWKRTVASQMSSAIYAQRSAAFAVKKYILGSSGSRLVFDGYRKVWTYGKANDTYLPDLTQGERVTIDSLKKIEKETKPPSRFSQASFVKTMEDLEIGRPATYASILETLKARDYIELNDSKSIVVTALGLCVLDFLLKVEFCFIDLGFTAKMEEKLDEIVNKKADKLITLTLFWNQLQKDLSRCTAVKEENSKTEYKCPKCENDLMRKHSKIGPFYGCSNYPKCKYIAQVGKDGEPVEKVKKPKKEIVYSEYKCPKCEEKMIARKSKFGEFHGCSKFPKCKGIRDKDGKVSEPKWKKRGKKKK